jgi:Arc/MetJ-type ribon-helix-helix transcriptional regulator
MSADVYNAREELLRAALRRLSAEHGCEEDSHHAAELEYSDELLALAARDLTRATDALPADEQPIGWGGEQGE